MSVPSSKVRCMNDNRVEMRCLYTGRGQVGRRERTNGKVAGGVGTVSKPRLGRVRAGNGPFLPLAGV